MKGDPNRPQRQRPGGISGQEAAVRGAMGGLDWFRRDWNQYHKEGRARQNLRKSITQLNHSLESPRPTKKSTSSRMGPILQYFQQPEKRNQVTSEHDSNRLECEQKSSSKFNCFDLEGRSSTFQGIPIIPEASLCLHPNISPCQYGQYAEMLLAEMYNSHITIKRVPPSSSISYQSIIIQELEVLSEIRHPNILLLMGIVHMDLYHVVTIFEEASSGSLYQLLHEQALIMPLQLITNLMAQLCQVMIFLHEKGWLHTAITSHAILLAKHNTLKLTGFELAQNIHKLQTPSQDEQQLRSQWFNWQAPEQLHDSQYTYKESDVFSAGLICWEMCTNVVPWRDFRRSEVVAQYAKNKGCAVKVQIADLPQPLSAMLLHVLQVDPKERQIGFLNMLNLVQDLHGVLSQVDDSTISETCTRWSPNITPRRLRDSSWQTYSSNTTPNGMCATIFSRRSTLTGVGITSQSIDTSSRRSNFQSSTNHSPYTIPRRCQSTIPSWSSQSPDATTRQLGMSCGRGALKKTRLLSRPQLQRAVPEPDPDPDPDWDPYTGLRRVHSYRRQFGVGASSSFCKQMEMRRLAWIPTCGTATPHKGHQPLVHIAKGHKQENLASIDSTTKHEFTKTIVNSTLQDAVYTSGKSERASLVKHVVSNPVLIKSIPISSFINTKTTSSQKSNQHMKEVMESLPRNDNISLAQPSVTANYNPELILRSLDFPAEAHKQPDPPAQPYKPTAIKPASHQNQRPLACTKVRPVVIPPLTMFVKSPNELQQYSILNIHPRHLHLNTTGKEQLGGSNVQISGEDKNSEQHKCLQNRSRRETWAKTPIRCPRIIVPSRCTYQPFTSNPFNLFHQLPDWSHPRWSENMGNQWMKKSIEGCLNKDATKCLIKVTPVVVCSKDNPTAAAYQFETTVVQGHTGTRNILKYQNIKNQGETELHSNTNSNYRYIIEETGDEKTTNYEDTSGSTEDLYIDDEFSLGMGLDSHMQLLSVQDETFQYSVISGDEVQDLKEFEQEVSNSMPSRNILEVITTLENQHTHSSYKSPCEIIYQDKIHNQTGIELLDEVQEKVNSIIQIKSDECKSVTLIPFCVRCQKQQLLETISMQERNEKNSFDECEGISESYNEEHKSNDEPLLARLAHKPIYKKECELFSVDCINYSVNENEDNKFLKINEGRTEIKGVGREIKSTETKIVNGTDFWNVPFDAD